MNDALPTDIPLYFPSKRQGAAHYASWTEYRKAANRNTDAPLWDVLSARAIRRRMKPGPASKNPSRAAALSIPWITFVLGPGCLSAADAIRQPADADSVRTRLATSLTGIDSAFPELSLSASATRFLELLVVQKTGLETVDDAFAAVRVREDVEPPEFSGLVVLAAALATQFYGAALDARQHVLQRSDREEVRIDHASSSYLAVENQVIAPLKHVLDLLKGAGDKASDPPQRRALAGLALAVDATLKHLSMRRLHVELLTSFAWYFFTAGTRVYPSWSELMILRSFDDDDWFTKEVVTSSDTSPRPRIAEMVGQAPWVRKRIVEVTNQSWKSREDGSGPTERDAFYDLVASFLEQQANAVLPSADKLASPVCFVTSFDLELEMALWSKGRPFVVILPVFAVEPNADGETSLHWVFTVIDPTDHTTNGPVTTDSVDHPIDLPNGLWNPTGWRIVSEDNLESAFVSHSQETRDQAGRLPLVVRLTGSPLMAVPRVDMLRPTPETSALHHALLLDEYIAIQQASLDLSTKQTMEENKTLPRGRGLPTFLSESPIAGPSRFWMFLGTQLGDTGVRLRLAAQQLAYRTPRYQQSRTELDDASASDDGGAATGRTLGVVVNAESQANDREVFLWQNFDVVDGRPLDLVGELKGLRESIETKLDEAAASRTVARGEANA